MPPDEAPLRAYSVHDGDEDWVIVFARRAVVARREGADEMGVDFADVESCRRLPSLDRYAGQEIPVDALLGVGWWFECRGCGRRIDRERVDDPDSDWDHDAGRARPQMSPVGHYGGSVFCTSTCRDWWLETRLWKESAGDLVVEELTRYLLDELPDATVTWRHAYVTDDCCVREANVRFTFPGARYGGGHLSFRNRSDDFRPVVRHLGGPRSVAWHVTSGDLDAWTLYREAVRASRPGWPRILEDTHG